LSRQHGTTIPKLFAQLPRAVWHARHMLKTENILVIGDAGGGKTGLQFSAQIRVEQLSSAVH